MCRQIKHAQVCNQTEIKNPIRLREEQWMAKHEKQGK